LVLHDSRILSWANDGTLRLWDDVTGRPLARHAGHLGCIKSVRVLGPHRVVSRDHHGVVCLWDIVTGALLGKRAGGEPYELSDGRFITVTPDGVVEIWDVATGTVQARLATPSDWRTQLVDDECRRVAARAWAQQHSLHDGAAVVASMSSTVLLQVRGRLRTCVVIASEGVGRTRPGPA